MLASSSHIASAAPGDYCRHGSGNVGEEIDMVLRYIRNHYISEAANQSLSLPASETKTRHTRPSSDASNIPANDFSSDAVLVYSDLGDRTNRIKTVLEAKPEATIKDLSEIITDVSTKTIQRDPNSLIASESYKTRRKTLV